MKKWTEKSIAAIFAFTGTILVLPVFGLALSSRIILAFALLSAALLTAKHGNSSLIAALALLAQSFVLVYLNIDLSLALWLFMIFLVVVNTDAKNLLLYLFIGIFLAATNSDIIVSSDIRYICFMAFMFLSFSPQLLTQNKTSKNTSLWLELTYSLIFLQKVLLSNLVAYYYLPHTTLVLIALAYVANLNRLALLMALVLFSQYQTFSSEIVSFLPVVSLNLSYGLLLLLAAGFLTVEKDLNKMTSLYLLFAASAAINYKNLLISYKKNIFENWIYLPLFVVLIYVVYTKRLYLNPDWQAIETYLHPITILILAIVGAWIFKKRWSLWPGKFRPFSKLDTYMQKALDIKQKPVKTKIIMRYKEIVPTANATFFSWSTLFVVVLLGVITWIHYMQ